MGGDKVLILNRGEIALRACRSARKVGLRPVLFITDGESPREGLAAADEFFFCPDDTPAGSFMNLERIETALKETGCRWLYPGYGFHSENPALAELAAKHDVGFIGPSAGLLRTMADKAAALEFARACGLRTLDFAADHVFREEDFPLLLKAVSGGGGRGNAVVPSLRDLSAAKENLARKAKELFQDDRLLAEKYLPEARHVELQIFGHAGRCLVLGTRDCSVQRAFQKVIEEGEAPAAARAALAPSIAKIEAELGRRAYEGAGTLEFLWDRRDGGIYFLEMNTRIQVEHPVTESVTGLDLVDLQFEIALGRKGLPSVRTSESHGIEVRVYAEDPARDFFPDSGKILFMHLPRLPFCRWDTAFSSGDSLSPSFDPMIAKLVVEGPDRATAMDRLSFCLGETVIHGVRTNLDFLKDVVDSADFRGDRHHIGWLEKDFVPGWSSRKPVSPEGPWPAMEASSAAAPTQASSAWKRSHRLETR